MGTSPGGRERGLKGRRKGWIGRLGRLCLSPRAQLQRHHGDRCLHSPQFEQCPAVLARARPLTLSPSFASLHPRYRFSAPSTLSRRFYAASRCLLRSPRAPFSAFSGKMNVIRERRERGPILIYYSSGDGRKEARSRNVRVRESRRRSGKTAKSDENRDFSPERRECLRNRKSLFLSFPLSIFTLFSLLPLFLS